MGLDELGVDLLLVLQLLRQQLHELGGTRRFRSGFANPTKKWGTSDRPEPQTTRENVDNPFLSEICMPLGFLRGFFPPWVYLPRAHTSQITGQI